jgi:diguanylate cyclase (GGDEF)-like protein
MLLIITSVFQPDPKPQPSNRGSWPERLRAMSRRMRQDVQLAIITLYSLCALLIIGPFAVFRLARGELAIGVTDSLIVVSFLALAALAWNPTWTRYVANLLAIVAASAVVFVILILGLSPMWAISTLVGNFLMAERRVALISNGIMAIAITMQPGVFRGMAEQATFVAVVIMTSLFSLIFASRVTTQRLQLSELAARDGLTGAFNRRSLDHDLARLIEDHSRQPHSLALLDLDNFKQLNDDHGHQAGDDILELLARVACEGTRGGDRFYRYGGEEFVLLLPETPLSGAEVALINLGQRFKEAQSGDGPPVTFSAGLAEYLSDEDPETWLTRADRALMQAKRAGKDCLRQSSSSRTVL